MAILIDNLGENGTKLRELIKEEKEPETIEQIEICLKHLLSQLSAKDREYHGEGIEELLELLEGEAETIRTDKNEVTAEWGFDNIQDLVNARLLELYDVCDSCRCWVEF